MQRVLERVVQERRLQRRQITDAHFGKNASNGQGVVDVRRLLWVFASLVLMLRGSKGDGVEEGAHGLWQGGAGS